MEMNQIAMSNFSSIYTDDDFLWENKEISWTCVGDAKRLLFMFTS